MTDLSHPTLAPIALAQLPTGSDVICATQRLAQTLSQSHDVRETSAESWPTLASTTFGQWLQTLYDGLSLRGQEPPALAGLRVLDGFEERLLWEQVIHQHLGTNDAFLFDIGALATTAAEAHALTINWAIRPASKSAAFATEEQLRFAEWQTTFLELCDSLRLIDTARLNATLIDHLPQLTSMLPQHLVFAGFDHYTPLEQRFQRQLATVGCRLYSLSLGDSDGDTPAVAIHGVENATAECLAVAQWAKDFLRRCPKARLGIVAPDLASYQHLLTDALEDVLDPALVLPTHASTRRPYNISLGQSLASTPVVRSALCLLQVMGEAHAVEQALIRTLLGSPYWSVHAENDARARLDTAMREGIAPKAPIARYSAYAEYLFDKQQIQAPVTLGHLNALTASARSLGKVRLPSEWRRWIQAVLRNTGWLANAHLRSHEFQMREAFNKALVKLGQLDEISGRISFSKALSFITQLCTERLFQPKTRGMPAIQILGVLEAAGMHFDALWVLGLTDTSWPPPANPNPLLPAETLRMAGAPNASAPVQLDFAQRIQHRLLQSAPNISFSYPRMNAATEQQPSPLIRGLGAEQPLIPLPKPWVNNAACPSHDRLVSLTDTLGPAVGEGDKVRGGTALLQAQAVCPAWGFFQFRLGAKALGQPVEGLDPRKRGTLIHDTLELFWNRTGSLAALQGMSLQARQAAVAAAASTALEKFNLDRKREALKPRQTVLEHQRLVKLVDAWLELESTRETGFTVLEAEGKREINIAGVVAEMRIDRIDRLDDGRMLIIDYKTGATIDIRNWSADRITEPQLPIYAALADHPTGEIAGVAFGIVRIGGATFKGIGQEDRLLPGVHAVSSSRGRRIFDAAKFSDWGSVLAHWRDTIRHVAGEVRAGYAGVSITAEEDLRYCDVKPLLRLAERQAQFDAAIAAERKELT